MYFHIVRQCGILKNNLYRYQLFFHTLTQLHLLTFTEEIHHQKLLHLQVSSGQIALY